MRVKFHKKFTEEVLQIFDKQVDSEGYVAEEDSGDRVPNQNGEDVEADNLASISKGSEIYVEDNFVSMLNFVKDRAD